jgi:ABC-type transport system substrate-binding protein
VHKGHDAIIVGLSAFALTAIEPISSGVEEGAQLATFPHESNPDVQPLIEQAKTETDEAKQEELLQEIAAKVCEANSHLFFANNDAIWGVKAEDSPFNPRPDLRTILFATNE